MGSDLVRSVVNDETGYSADYPDAEIIMDANESPYDIPDEIKQATFEQLRTESYNRYPDSQSKALRQQLSTHLNVPVGNIVAGNGSDELISYIFTACVDPGDTILVANPSFSIYEILGQQQGAEVINEPLDDDWSLTTDFVKKSREAKLTFIGYPNNPTGNCFESNTIESIIDETKGLVVMDEAYYEFCGCSFIDTVPQSNSLVVLRTLSKAFSLAGIRVGVLTGPDWIVDAVNTVKLPYNLNKMSQITAVETLKKRDSVLEKIDTILDERDRLFRFLKNHSFAPFPTDSNFILFRPKKPDELYHYLLDHGIRLRKFSGSILGDFLRVSVGTPEQNTSLIEAMRKYES